MPDYWSAIAIGCIAGMVYPRAGFFIVGWAAFMQSTLRAQLHSWVFG